MYSFVIYYNSKDGEEIAVASPSEIEKVEPTAEAEMQKPEEMLVVLAYGNDTARRRSGSGGHDSGDGR